MKVLVTGGAGYIGSHTVNRLLSLNHTVVVFDNLSSGFKESIPSESVFVLGDIRDDALLTATLLENQIETVIHFAAKLVVPESVAQPIEYYENNTLGVLSLVKACKNANVKSIIFSSTAAVYGDAHSDALLTENSALRPTNPYGFSKLMSEEILKSCEVAYGTKHVVLRYFNVAGASLDGKNGQRSKKATHLIKVAAEAACGKRDKVEVFGSDYETSDGTGVRDYIHVEDLAELHILALNYLAEGGKSQTFNCGYGKGTSVREVISAMSHVAGKTLAIVESPRRPGDVAKLIADPSLAMQALKWTPQFDSLEDICKSAYLWESKI